MMPNDAWLLRGEPDGFTAFRPNGDAITLVTTGRWAGRIWARSAAGGSALINDTMPALAALLGTAGWTVTPPPPNTPPPTGARP